MHVLKRNGQLQERDDSKYRRQIEWCCAGIAGVNPDKLQAAIKLSLYDRIPTSEINMAIRVAAAGLISEQEPNWTYVAARMVLQEAYKVVNKGEPTYNDFFDYMSRNTSAETLDNELLSLFDLQALADAITPERDWNFDYLGALTVTDRYLNKDAKGRLIELPQHWFMRVAMGIARDENTKEKRTEWAIRYYDTYSQSFASPSTPTLFNSGTLMPQMSSCFGTTFFDDTDKILDSIRTNARFSKMAGGCSASFTHIRSTGSFIKSTGGKASGPVPYMKLFQDTLNAWDQSGKRKGAGASYTEVWHADIENILKLHDPGDERQRTHDLFIATWIPDLFMERVANHAMWTLFDPAKVPMLMKTHSQEFCRWYEKYEAEGLGVKQIDAETLWREILTKWVQQSVGWPCFKDEINARYTQPDHMVHHSNLCTEITLRNDKETSFVCNLTSWNAAKALKFEYDRERKRIKWNPELEKRVRICVRSLDSVISVGITPDPTGRKFQMEDRAIGLGVMGWTEMLYAHGIPYESEDAVIWSNEIWKQVCATAIDESHRLAMEKGEYPNFKNSTWAQGKLPIDTVRKFRIIEKFDLKTDLVDCPFAPHGWHDLRERAKLGMRNSTLTAIAPTATIANIHGTTPCTELMEDRVSLKENLSGDFKVVAPYVARNPFNLPIKTAFETDHMWTVWQAAARQLWICQAQSTNYWINPNDWKPLRGIEKWADYVDELVFEAWRCAVKTSYYMHNTSVANKATSVVVTQPGPAQDFDPSLEADWTGGRVCSIDAGPDCEACQ